LLTSIFVYFVCCLQYLYLCLSTNLESCETLLLFKDAMWHLISFFIVALQNVSEGGFMVSLWSTRYVHFNSIYFSFVFLRLNKFYCLIFNFTDYFVSPLKSNLWSPQWIHFSYCAFQLQWFLFLFPYMVFPFCPCFLDFLHIFFLFFEHI
jgi:hypothetical protein